MNTAIAKACGAEEQIVRKYIILDSKVALIGLKNDEKIIITKPEDVQIIGKVEYITTTLS